MMNSLFFFFFECSCWARGEFELWSMTLFLRHLNKNVWIIAIWLFHDIFRFFTGTRWKFSHKLFNFCKLSFKVGIFFLISELFSSRFSQDHEKTQQKIKLGKFLVEFHPIWILFLWRMQEFSSSWLHQWFLPMKFNFHSRWGVDNTQKIKEWAPKKHWTKENSNFPYNRFSQILFYIFLINS